MALRKLLLRPLPAPPDQVPGVRAVVDQVFAAPEFTPVRLFLDRLYKMRSSWLVLVPLLVWVFVRTYRRERAKVLAEHGQG